MAHSPMLGEVKELLSQWLPENNAPDAEIVEWPEENESYRARIEAMMRPCRPSVKPCAAHG